MSITPVPISMRLVRTPIAARSGNGAERCRAKWWTRTKAPSIPISSAATASSTVCRSASAALSRHAAGRMPGAERKEADPLRVTHTRTHRSQLRLPCVFGGGEAGGLAERNVPQPPGEREGDDHDRGGRQEHRVQRRRDGRDIEVVDHRRQLMDERRAGMRGRMHARRQPARELLRELVREDRAEGRDADRAADLPEQRGAGRRDAEQPVGHRVLRGEHEHLHDQPEPEPEDQHVRGRTPVGVSTREPREQVEPDRSRPPCPAIGKAR